VYADRQKSSPGCVQVTFILAKSMGARWTWHGKVLAKNHWIVKLAVCIRSTIRALTQIDNLSALCQTLSRERRIPFSLNKGGTKNSLLANRPATGRLVAFQMPLLRWLGWPEQLRRSLNCSTLMDALNAPELRLGPCKRAA
jgi:hypothetical protein